MDHSQLKASQDQLESGSQAVRVYADTDNKFGKIFEK